MIRVVVTGSECTGKTTLSKAIAEHFGAIWVPEYVRQFVEETRRTPTYEDVDRIARGQMALEDSLAGQDQRLLIQDTDLLSTIVYSRHYYGDCPRWIDRALTDRAPDLYLLADIDVPWVADGDQRDRGDQRKEMQELFRQALEIRALTFTEIRGSRAHRLNLAIEAIEQLSVEVAGS